MAEASDMREDKIIEKDLELKYQILGFIQNKQGSDAFDKSPYLISLEISLFGLVLS